MKVFEILKENVGEKGLLEGFSCEEVQTEWINWVARTTKDKKVMEIILEFPEQHYELSKNPEFPISLVSKLKDNEIYDRTHTKIKYNIAWDKFISSETPKEALENIFIQTVEIIKKRYTNNKSILNIHDIVGMEEEEKRVLALMESMPYELVTRTIKELWELEPKDYSNKDIGGTLKERMITDTKDTRIFQDLIEYPDVNIWVCVWNAPNITQEEITKIKDKTIDNEWKLRLIRDYPQRFSGEELQEVYFENNGKDRDAMGTKCSLIRYWINSCTPIPEEIQEEMIATNNECPDLAIEARGTIAPIVTNKDLLRILEKDTRITVKRQLAKNKHISKECHKKYLNTKDEDLQLILAGNEMTSTKEIDEIVSEQINFSLKNKYDLKRKTRKYLAKILDNPNTSVETVENKLVAVEHLPEDEAIIIAKSRFGRMFGRALYHRVKSEWARERIYETLSEEAKAMVSII
ncbi:MAG: hypothetical protein AMQ74_01745 [Candidatus Methanofastidiosum methylothiophilum]|uniref:Uncharacterized protein n=1 Tax=Candidatus Methanofastidiosum methylothiophilum TaxID=1705564 RepID=A0A150IPH3_9EURY|nr:MAG: hypothetical protein AMQ74_01745 [Candidatus Methanofastidiosum methylthiophilus]